MVLPTRAASSAGTSRPCRSRTIGTVPPRNTARAAAARMPHGRRPAPGCGGPGHRPGTGNPRCRPGLKEPQQLLLMVLPGRAASSAGTSRPCRSRTIDMVIPPLRKTRARTRGRRRWPGARRFRGIDPSPGAGRRPEAPPDSAVVADGAARNGSLLGGDLKALQVENDRHGDSSSPRLGGYGHRTAQVRPGSVGRGAPSAAAGPARKGRKSGRPSSAAPSASSTPALPVARSIDSRRSCSPGKAICPR